MARRPSPRARKQRANPQPRAKLRASRTRLIFEMQEAHAFLLAVLLIGAALLARIDGFSAGELWGVSTPIWFWLTLGAAVAHQVYVWLCWRLQLHASLLTRWFGGHAFSIFAVLFALLGLSRVLLLIPLAIANRDTVPGDPALLQFLALILLIPAGYLFYSVAHYFGFRRAFGIDHFDPGYRRAPLVREGIFRYSPNGMYVFGFLLLWSVALWYASVAALIAALFNHLYIWVHYYATERPDMRRIYGGGAPAESRA